MVAGSHGVIAGGVHELDGGLALRQVDDGRALGGVAGGEQEHLGALLLELLLQSGHAGVAEDLFAGIGHGHIGAVGVVGMEDHDLALHVIGDGVGGDGLLGLLVRGHGGSRQGQGHDQRERQGQKLLAHWTFTFPFRIFFCGTCANIL